MASSSPQKYPNFDGLPLSQLSPMCINGRSAKQYSDNETAFPFMPASPTRRKLPVDAPTSPNSFAAGLPLSPSLPEFSALKNNLRTNTDVSCLVKRFEHLDVRDRDAESVERRRKHEEALNRAKMAREEAESEAKRWKDEARMQRRQVDEFKERETKMGRRMEVLMEEFSRAKEQWSSQAGIYEKEVRKARKEAFKSSSTVLKIQEDTKATRAELRAAHGKLDLVQRKCAKSEDDSFSAQYQLVAMQEELERLRARLHIIDEERETLKTSLKEEEVARIAAEGRIALPPPANDDGDDDVAASPRKSPSPRKMFELPGEDKENTGVVTKKMVEARSLQKQLMFERRRLQSAHDMIDFLRLECRFRCCQCNSQKAKKARMSVDEATNSQMERLELMRQSALGSESSKHTQEQADEMDVTVESETVPACGKTSMAVANTTAITHDEHDDRSLTMPHEQAPEALTPSEETLSVQPEGDDHDDSRSDTSVSPRSPSASPLSYPSPHQHKSVRTITTTTKVPMHFTPISKSAAIPCPRPIEEAENIPPVACATNVLATNIEAKAYPFDREAALAAIAYRRGRAKSFAQGNLTPRRQMIEGIKERRDISAPALTG